jgi:hypothetical protein
VLVRADIPAAAQIVQTGHACLEAGRRFRQPETPCNLVVLSVPTERHLHAAVARIESAGIRSAVFYEPDDDLGYTAACTEPVSGPARRIFRRLQLWQFVSSDRAPPGKPGK